MTTATLERPGQRFIAASAERLLGEARATLDEAERCADEAERYAGAHLAALRTAAAVLADRARAPVATGRRSRRPTSAWALLSQTAPELGEWAAYFASGATKRAAAQAGLRGAVTTRDADDLCREVAAFIAIAEARLGMLPLDCSHAEPTSRAARSR